ncbi:hypothetical protein GRF59_15025 [Paenibacillus sp. HJL G12]|uniref:Uncharacterized protein n=1 Tax=Paenibacillus dendrobii TaxID=2691084 RepID=A0A7X3LIT7_9BACL|nr:hypothetical protein [Paenibacillus dendrobii]MWV44933.1 hypothetical protein [Paenibacillus dendrobii]
MTLEVDYILFVDRVQHNKRASIYDVPNGEEREVHDYVKEQIVRLEKTTPNHVKIMYWTETE